MFKTKENRLILLLVIVLLVVTVASAADLPGAITKLFTNTSALSAVNIANLII